MVRIEYRCEQCEYQACNDETGKFVKPFLYYLSDAVKHVVENPNHFVDALIVEEETE